MKNTQAELAEKIAREAHAGQFRRDGVTPYITHPEAVAKSLEGEHDHVIAAAWLHDVVEDTGTTMFDLLLLGVIGVVRDVVSLLTRDDGEEYDTYLELLKENQIARKVKIADIRHNLSCEPTERQIKKYTKALEYLGAEI